MDIGSKVVTVFNLCCILTTGEGRAAGGPGATVRGVEFLWQSEECSIQLPMLQEQRAQFQRVKLLSDLNGGAPLPLPRHSFYIPVLVIYA